MKIAKREAWKEFVSIITAEKPSQQIWQKIRQILGKGKTHKIKKTQDFRPKNGQRTSNNGKHPSHPLCRGMLEHTSLKKNKIQTTTKSTTNRRQKMI
jgi:hypothetical protein